MTRDLQRAKRRAEANPGVVVPLETKGVSFGSIVFADGELDTSGVEGVESDLVVRPFGRKGGFATVRAFAIGAMQFHHGMQPTEVVGIDADPDEDGVVNEILVGELSALHIFAGTLEHPGRTHPSQAVRRGRELFIESQCATCHIRACPRGAVT